MGAYFLQAFVYNYYGHLYYFSMNLKFQREILRFLIPEIR